MTTLTDYERGKEAALEAFRDGLLPIWSRLCATCFGLGAFIEDERERRGLEGDLRLQVDIIEFLADWELSTYVDDGQGAPSAAEREFTAQAAFAQAFSEANAASVVGGGLSLIDRVDHMMLESLTDADDDVRRHARERLNLLLVRCMPNTNLKPGGLFTIGLLFANR